MSYEEIVKESLNDRQIRSRVGKRVWVSDIGLQFWADPNKGQWKTIQECHRLPNGIEILKFEDGTMRQLRFNNKGGSHGFLVFDQRPPAEGTSV